MNYANFKNAKHPSAEMRGAAVKNIVQPVEGADRLTLRGAALGAAMAVFSLSERFLYRQYHHRDQALEALERGDLDEAKRHLNEIGNSGHNLNDGTPIKG